MFQMSITLSPHAFLIGFQKPHEACGQLNQSSRGNC